MYSLEEIKVVHLEITSKCQAKCPMCSRNLQGGQVNPMIELEEITLEQFKNWFPIEFITQLDSLYMCGNLGDPVIAKDTLEIYQYLRENNPNILSDVKTVSVIYVNDDYGKSVLKEIEILLKEKN